MVLASPTNASARVTTRSQKPKAAEHQQQNTPPQTPLLVDVKEPTQLFSAQGGENCGSASSLRAVKRKATRDGLCVTCLRGGDAHRPTTTCSRCNLAYHSECHVAPIPADSDCDIYASDPWVCEPCLTGDETESDCKRTCGETDSSCGVCRGEILQVGEGHMPDVIEDVFESLCARCRIVFNQKQSTIANMPKEITNLILSLAAMRHPDVSRLLTHDEPVTFQPAIFKSFAQVSTQQQQQQRSQQQQQPQKKTKQRLAGDKTYEDMIAEALFSLKEKGGSKPKSIFQWMQNNYASNLPDGFATSTAPSQALRRGVERGRFYKPFNGRYALVMTGPVEGELSPAASPSLKDTELLQ